VDALLVVLGVFLATLLYCSWSSARSYLEVGRKRGMEEAVRELARGLGSHCELESGAMSAPVQKAMDDFNKLLAHGRLKRGSTNPFHAQLWVLGNAIGDACWVKGHAAGVRRKAPAEGKIRVDLSINELLQISWLAHLGFQHMMPNYRGFETYRFSSEEDATEAARAVSRVEASVPPKDRPIADLTVQFKNRQKLIGDWWEKPGRLTA
jgi:hypothetical protein